MRLGAERTSQQLINNYKTFTANLIHFTVGENCWHSFILKDTINIQIHIASNKKRILFIFISSSFFFFAVDKPCRVHLELLLIVISASPLFSVVLLNTCPRFPQPQKLKATHALQSKKGITNRRF